MENSGVMIEEVCKKGYIIYTGRGKERVAIHYSTEIAKVDTSTREMIVFDIGCDFSLTDRKILKRLHSSFEYNSGSSTESMFQKLSKSGYNCRLCNSSNIAGGKDLIVKI